EAREGEGRGDPASDGVAVVGVVHGVAREVVARRGGAQGGHAEAGGLGDRGRALVLGGLGGLGHGLACSSKAMAVIRTVRWAQTRRRSRFVSPSLSLTRRCA